MSASLRCWNEAPKEPGSFPLHHDPSHTAWQPNPSNLTRERPPGGSCSDVMDLGTARLDGDNREVMQLKRG